MPTKDLITVTPEMVILKDEDVNWVLGELIRDRTKHYPKWTSIAFIEKSNFPYAKVVFGKEIVFYRDPRVKYLLNQGLTSIAREQWEQV
ncbi:MAG: hypothetical protein KAS32_09150 [Candidatus Peribacteraceae bacterium]|nr:hypothetical protein [Candidatus Peribacteraceae bacterium]